MFRLSTGIAAMSVAISLGSASHLDNTNGAFDNYSFDSVKFKTRTNCSLDKYPEVSDTTLNRLCDPCLANEN